MVMVRVLNGCLGSLEVMNVSKNRGGLCFRNLYDFNITFLKKH